MVRLTFSKKGTAKFISHLDIVRCMTRTFRRADIPVKFTEGFNPHPHMVFSAPLSLGVESECEYLDIKLTEAMPLDEIVTRLNRVSVPGIVFTHATELARNFNDIAFARYTLHVNGKTLSDFERFWGTDKIEVEKKTKKGMSVVDLKTEFDIDSVREANGGIDIVMTCPCGNQKNINPLLLLPPMFASFGDGENPVYSLLRHGFYDAEGNEF